MTAIKVIGVGNPYRRDDAAGLVAADRLMEMPAAGLVVEQASGEGVDLMQRWSDTEFVILIDAVRSGAKPGTIRSMDPYSESIPGSFFSYSTHAFGVAEAVEMARALHRLPPRLLIIGIEGADFSPGAGLTSTVQEAVTNVVGEVVATVREVLTSERLNVCSERVDHAYKGPRFI